MKIIIATHNQSKVEEFRRILTPLNIEVITPDSLGLSMEAEETGTTFLANAEIKARELYSKTGLPTIADDSGLVVDALNGRPGVKTARYGGENTSYPEKFELMFSELAGVAKEKRTARFVCSIYCILSDKSIITVEESCEGYIGTQAKGKDGFGYDPIFYVNNHSFAEIQDKEKDKISHRGKALKELAKQINYPSRDWGG